MALQGFEVVVIGLIVVVLFMWGPKKLPELARSIGQAKREFDAASRDYARPISTPPVEETASSGLIDLAQKLGVSTQGKTLQQISDDIVKAKRA